MFVAPTVETFIQRFPSLAAIDPGTIEMVLDEALGQVGETWLERDRAPAILYLSAHLLADEGHGEDGSVVGGAAGSGPVRKIKVGDVETEFAGIGGRTAQGTGTLSQYYSTIYGRRYVALLRKNFPAVMVV